MGCLEAVDLHVRALVQPIKLGGPAARANKTIKQRTSQHQSATSSNRATEQQESKVRSDNNHYHARVADAVGKKNFKLLK